MRSHENRGEPMRNQEMKWYLAGPMSGIAQFNIPAFDEATTRLREFGYDVTSPVELDSDEVREAALASKTGKSEDVTRIETWGSMLARDVRLITDEMDGIILLPDWELSRGAKLEAYVGLLTDKQFASYRRSNFWSIDRDLVSVCLRNRIT